MIASTMVVIKMFVIDGGKNDETNDTKELKALSARVAIHESWSAYFS